MSQTIEVSGEVSRVHILEASDRGPAMAFLTVFSPMPGMPRNLTAAVDFTVQGDDLVQVARSLRPKFLGKDQTESTSWPTSVSNVAVRAIIGRTGKDARKPFTMQAIATAIAKVTPDHDNAAEAPQAAPAK